MLFIVRYQLGEHNQWEKFTNFELGTRVPLIIKVWQRPPPHYHHHHPPARPPASQPASRRRRLARNVVGSAVSSDIHARALDRRGAACGSVRGDNGAHTTRGLHTVMHRGQACPCAPAPLRPCVPVGM